MKKIILKHLLVAVSFLSTTLCTAQSITIKSVTMQPSDLTAVEHPVFDINGDTCALLKIKTDYLEGIEFSNSNQYVKANYANGIYSVYVPIIGRKLDFRHKDYLSGTIDMGEYGYKRLKGGKTYLVTLDALRVSELKSTIVFKVEPIDAIVSFNGKNIDLSDNGVYEIPVSQGSYNYEVKKENYESQKGTMNVGKAEAKSLSIKLKQILHQCNVKGNVNNARVLVDNIDYGKTGSLFLPQGQHNIRIQADGYIDCSFDINIMSPMEIPFTMNENSIVTEVHATPVVIYSPGASVVYKDNKKIKDWYDGKEVLLMPGKYLFSDDLGNKKKVVVGNEAMKVELSCVGIVASRQENANNSGVNNSDKSTASSSKNSKSNNYLNSLKESLSNSTSDGDYNTYPSRYNSTPSRSSSTSPSRYNSTPSRDYRTSPSRYNSTPSRSSSTSPSHYNSTPSRSSSTTPSRYNNSPTRSYGTSPSRSGSTSTNQQNIRSSGSYSSNGSRTIGGSGQNSSSRRSFGRR